MAELILRGAAIGLGGAAMMDVWALLSRRAFGVHGLDYGLLGRWIGHIAQGRFFHERIADAKPVRGERAMGWGAHYAIGIGFACVLLMIWGLSWARSPTIGPALLIGWATVLAPWLVMQPGMGAGIAASKTPDPGAARLRTLVTHTVYGLGLYAAAVPLSII